MMFNKEVKKFYDEMIKDEKAVKNIKEKFNEESQKESLKEFLNKNIMPIARKRGFNFSLQELLKYEIEINKENKKIINENELEEISGGGISKSLLIGGISSILMLGAGILINNDTHAEVQISDVKSSIKSISDMQNSEEVKKDEEERISLIPAAESTDEVVLSKPIEEKKEETSESFEKSEQKSAPLVSEEETSSKIEKQKVMATSSVNKMSEISKSSDDVVENQETDVKYIAEALNMAEPYVYKVTGITENFRLYNGNINSISIGKISNQVNVESRLYNKDEGEGSANVMRCLFPSSAGTLSSEGGSDRLSRFTKDCEPTPELVAKISGYLYKIRTNKEDLKAINEKLDKFQENPNKFKKGDFLKNFFDNDERKGKEEKTLFDLLKNMTYMIEKEESDKENPIEEDVKSGKALPKYTTERMLMSYFIDHFNTNEEVNRFYSKVKELIKIDSSKKTNPEDSIEKLNYLINLIEKSDTVMKNLYAGIPIQNGSAKIVNLEEKDGNKIIKINKNVFADCADVLVRHVMNFSLYNGDDGFNLVQGGKQEDLNKLIDAIDKNGEVEYKDLKERLQLFYLYQTRDKVNDGNMLTRTLWNYVISNMKNESLEMYPIKYVRDKVYELETGFINMTKLCYNLAYALKDGQGCNEAKIAIDKLNEESSEEDLKEALEKTLKILNPDMNIVNLEHLNKNGLEIYGEAKVGIGSAEFNICQNSGHSSIDYTLFPKFEIEPDEKEKLNNIEIAKLLVYKFNNDDNQNINLFHRLYLKKVSTSEIKSNYEKKSEALRFLKEFQGEENNINRISEELIQSMDFFEGSKSININKEKGKTLFNYIFDEFIIDNLKVFESDDDIRSKIIDTIKVKIIEQDGLKYALKSDNTCVLYSFNESNIKENIEIPESITNNRKKYTVISINENAFEDCEKLVTVKFEKSSQLKKISKGAFNNCTKLISIIMPESVMSIDNSAFSNCKELRSMFIPKNVNKIGKGIFLNCNNLESIIVDKKNVLYYSENGILFDKSKGILVCYPSGKMDEVYKIPSDVKIIDYCAFSGCEKIKTIEIPKNTKEISDFTFFGCINLERVDFEEDSQLEKIGEYIFYGCKKIKMLEIPSSVKIIVVNAFVECENLKAIKLGSNSQLESEENPFFCESLEKIIVKDEHTREVLRGLDVEKEIVLEV